MRNQPTTVAVFFTILALTGCAEGAISHEIGDAAVADTNLVVDLGVDAPVADAVVFDADATDASFVDATSDALDVADAGVDLGPSDLGVDATSPDLGMDAGPTDLGVDLGAPDMGVDLGAPDLGVDLGAPDMGVDLGPADMGVDMTIDAGPSCNYACTINLLDSSLTTCGTSGSLVAPYGDGAGSGTYVGEISFTPGFIRLEMTAHVCSPTGFAIDVCDDQGGCNGYGGGAGTTEYVAELNLIGSNLYLYGDNYTPAGAGSQLFTQMNFADPAGCKDVTFNMGDQFIESTTDALAWDSPYGLRLNPPLDDHMASDANWYFAINRTVQNAARSGTGVQTVDFCFHRITR